jgi:hypothetical protein
MADLKTKLQCVRGEFAKAILAIDNHPSELTVYPIGSNDAANDAHAYAESRTATGKKLQLWADYHGDSSIGAFIRATALVEPAEATRVMTTTKGTSKPVGLPLTTLKGEGQDLTEAQHALDRLYPAIRTAVSRCGLD